MNESGTQSAIRGVSIVSLLLALWLIVSPYLFGYSGAELWTQTILGIVVGVFAVWRLAATEASWASWVNAIVGLALVIAPYAFNYQHASAYWNEVIVAIALVVLEATNANLHIGHPRQLPTM